MSNHLTIIPLILEAGTKVDAVDEAGMTPLHIICAFPVQECVELAKLLIKHGAKVDVLPTIEDVRRYTMFALSSMAKRNLWAVFLAW
jgi:ankyrin repeat protein